LLVFVWIKSNKNNYPFIDKVKDLLTGVLYKLNIYKVLSLVFCMCCGLKLFFCDDSYCSFYLDAKPFDVLRINQGKKSLGVMGLSNGFFYCSFYLDAKWTKTSSRFEDVTAYLSRLCIIIVAPLLIIVLQSLILIAMFILPLVTSANRQFFSDVVGMASLMNIW